METRDNATEKVKAKLEKENDNHDVQLQTNLISEDNKDNLISHHMAAKSLANKVSNDESSEDGSTKI